MVKYPISFRFQNFLCMLNRKLFINVIFRVLKLSRFFQELEKQASKKLKLTAKETMRIAEQLYTRGLISYPRTETNKFPPEMDLRRLVEDQSRDPRWGGAYSVPQSLGFQLDFRRTRP